MHEWAALFSWQNIRLMRGANNKTRRHCSNSLNNTFWFLELMMKPSLVLILFLKPM
ncbi:hypothetical protein LEBR102806_12190 [Levilactobacillus brevis]|uniref:Uncharacterized protein n=1 Tax=Levilactobacillus brevis ATCC 14869 = DSM 20054 TaxID=649758 RepID=U2NU90_LEVBR|nr:hypothetical protein HMPREF0495_02164 [Levilactobacillus brevis ATCC 14869 = DSM 20054]